MGKPTGFLFEYDKFNEVKLQRANMAKKIHSDSKSPTEGLVQINAKVEQFRPTTLEQIWGEDGYSKYKTTDEAEYKQSLAEMSRVDLHKHSAALGIFPSENRGSLEKKLMAEFLRHVNSFKVPTAINNAPIISKEALDILKEGR